MLSLLPGIHRLNQPGLAPDEAEAIRKQLLNRRVLLRALLIVSLMSLSNERLAATELSDELAAIRGANYTPSYASTSVGAWLNYDAAVVERELAYAQRLQLNSVRVFLSTVAYEHNPEAFRQNVADLVERCHAHKIRPLFVLFDSCFGPEPSLERVSSEMWVNNPGYSRLGKDSWPALENYVRAVVQPLLGDTRVLGWDVMNEPMADFEHVTRVERDVIWEFVRHFCRFVKLLDPAHPITVGHAVAEYIPRTSDMVDATECFELGLSIPHLFRMGKEAEAIECYERLLRLARKWMVAD
jgi:hypothetical protein